jgi:alpha-galactosidase
LVSSPMLIGCDMERLDDFTYNLLSNDEVLAVSQDSLGKQGTSVVKDGAARIYAKDLEDGSKAVGLFNTGTNGTITVTVKWSDLNITGKQTVRDLWRQKDLGQFSDKFELAIPPHGAELVKISTKTR